MGIENSKRWHWIIVALVVGPALAFMNGQAEPGAGMRSMSGEDFEREVVRHDFVGDKPNLTDIVVHPPQVGAYGKPVYVVTMDRAGKNSKTGRWDYQKYALLADVPYVATIGGNGQRITKAALAAEPNRTILSVLKDIAAKNPQVKYKYAWWEEPKWSYALWSVGALVGIGGIWPTVLALMLGAGLGPKPKEEEYDLDRFKSSEGEEDSAAGKPAAPKEMSEGDREKLQTQLEKLEKNIGTAAVMTDVPALTAAGATAAGGAAPIRQLNGGPVEMQTPLDKEEEDKEYKGEFYPVARVAQPKAEEPAGK